MLFFSPLEQFSILRHLSLSLFCVDISITNSTIFLTISCSLITFVLLALYSNVKLLSSCWQNLFETFYFFVLNNIVRENIKNSGNLYFPTLFSLFLFIFLSNIIGMIPYSFTTTSHIIVTFTLALFLFFGINYTGFKLHGLALFSLFLPSGAPLLLAPLLVFIEVVSYCFRVVSLSLRLFANMMSGHCLLKILAGFSWTMFSSPSILSFFHLVPLMIIFCITGLEFAIAFLQAYVFTLLISVYLSDAINLH